MAGGVDMFDVAVVGGGPAGIAAAMAASACGAATVLLEREDVLGGNVSQAFVHTICGLYLPSARREAVHAHPGIPQAFARALERSGRAGGIGWAGTAAYLAIDPMAFAELALHSCSRAGVDVRCRSTLTAVELGATPREPSRLHVQHGDAVAARTVVDCSGDAAVAALAGAAVEQAGPLELQHCSYIFRVDGVGADGLDAMEGARTGTAVARAARRGALPPAAASITIRRGVAGVSGSRSSAAGASVFVTVNLPKPDPQRFDPLDASVLERMNHDAREAARAILEYLVRERPPFADAVMGAQPARAGIRETRRVRGRERLELDDVLSGRRRQDEACLSTWPVELWERSDRLSFRAGAGPCSIPLGALVAADSDVLAMAGRCASASHEASGATRVIGTSMAMGEAAGVACALAARDLRSLVDIAPEDIRSVISAGKTCATLHQGG
ncbi:MAG TPA: FAD-dependent oxidoreductase [Candidatus Limnocylindrales bacterium]|nr:FAD-dependent oxidoreductase [Candidatus Limnocylindrales bacterium]